MTGYAKLGGTGGIREIDFATHVKPLLERSCVGCHGAASPKGNFRVTDRDGLLRGGESGIPAITVGRGIESPLARQLRGLVEDMEMPPLGKREKYPALSDGEIGRISAWIDGGAAWPDGVAVAPTSEVVPTPSSDTK